MDVFGGGAGGGVSAASRLGKRGKVMRVKSGGEKVRDAKCHKKAS